MTSIASYNTHASSFRADSPIDSLPSGHGLTQTSKKNKDWRKRQLEHIKIKLETRDDTSDEDDVEVAYDAERGPPDHKVGKAAHTAHFAKWFANKAYKIQTGQAPNPVQIQASDEMKSIKSLLSATTKQIISDPREYQLELFERAKLANTLAVLDTGSGKTLIATLLIRHMLDQELEIRKKNGPKKICVFLVDSVTLVFQQGAVLECNLDVKIGKYCGELGADNWRLETWQTKLKDEMVIVATADTIYNCLTHSFMRMSQINLLIFDECHHAKKNHAYARIMKDFYTCEDSENQPRIFGMTASPVDARVDVVKAARRLEKLLHSQICTASDLSLLQKFINRPKESALVYEPLIYNTQTPLMEKLAPYCKIECLQPLYRFCKAAAAELGPWCADHVWSFGLSEMELLRQERRVGLKNKSAIGDDPAQIEAEIKQIRAARAVVENHNFAKPKATREFLSSKLLILYSYLRQKYAKPMDYKCIVFVTRRYTAKVIEDLFKELSFPHVKLGTLFGTSGFTLGNDSMSFRQQTLTLHKFRKGQLNCLVATSVAEEGLDIPDCNLVIRFDLYSTMIQYVQSRGRARHSTSDYIHMAEAGNSQHAQAINDVQMAEATMKNFCLQLPEDRLLDRDVSYDPSYSIEQNNAPTFLVTPAGAKLTVASAMSTLSHFVNKLGCSELNVQRAVYSNRPIFGKGYVCEVLLPPESPIITVEGWVCTTKAEAKAAAAFEACRMLLEKKYLDDNLLPIYADKLRPAMANAHLAVDMYKTNTYLSKIKPSFWYVNSPDDPTELHVAIHYIEKPDELGRSVQPFAIFSRNKLPECPPFFLYFESGGASQVITHIINKPVKCDAKFLEKLNIFSFRFFQDIFNKRFEIETSKMPYWVFPVQDKIAYANYDKIGPMDILDWDLIEFAVKNDDMHFNAATEPAESYIDRFLIDKRQRSRRFFVHGTDPTMNPYSETPDGCCRAPFSITVLDYSFSAGKRGWGRWKDEVPETQPVLIANRVLHRINALDVATEREKTQTTLAYICPSNFIVSVLPAKFCQMGLLFPSITCRIDAYLHAWDVCKILSMNVPLNVALEAITKDADNTSEHGEDAVNKRRGMGNNYERLEFLGDCFLKLGTTISLFSQNPENDEFEYHVKRMLLICNQNLFNRACELELYKYIQTEGFSRRLWYPNIKLLEGKGAGKVQITRTHNLGDKSIADVCEALIGAAFQESGMDMATKVVTALLQTEQHNVKDWKDYWNLYTIPYYQSTVSTASQIDLAEQVEKEIGYKFKYPRLLRSAFTHPSLPNNWEKIPCYQRLEFLGDALIDMACVIYLWEKFPGKDPQWLTEHKMSMINNRFQGALCCELGFHKHIRLVGGQLSSAIQEYVALIQEAKLVSNNSVDYWVDLKAPPKALPDVLEAVVGAMFVDSQFDFSVVQSWFDHFVLPSFQNMNVYDTFAGNHPVTLLTTKMTELFCDDWRILSKDFKDDETSYVLTAVLCHNEIFAEGQHATIKNARVDVAKKALKKLAGMEKEKFYEICNCEAVRQRERIKREEEKERREVVKKQKKLQGFVDERGMVDLSLLEKGEAGTVLPLNYDAEARKKGIYHN